jgi:hypothetical protein
MAYVDATKASHPIFRALFKFFLIPNGVQSTADIYKLFLVVRQLIWVLEEQKCMTKLPS